MNPFNVRLIHVGVLFMLDVIMQWTYGEQEGGGNNVAPSKKSSLNQQTYRFQVGDDYAIQQLAAIVDALENLTILSGDKQNCYMVDKIIKVSTDVNSNTQRIGIEFYVSQLQPSIANTQKINSEPNKALNGSSSLLSRNTSDAQNSDNLTSNCPNGIVTLINVTDTNIAQADNTNHTVESSEVLREEQDDGRRKLSHTQVMVISTCSTVIGLFFIVALIMRVRNYLKRKNGSEDGTRRSNMRSTSMTLRSNNQSPARSASIASKCGFPETSIPISSQQLKNGSAVHNSLAPPGGAPDSKPLLVITSASAPSSPLTRTTQYAAQNHKQKHVNRKPAFRKF